MQHVLRISRKVDYALRAMIYLASVDPKRIVPFREIAPRMRVPKDFLAKIMKTLANRGLVKSTRGARGGYQLSRPAREIGFLDVIEAVEGPIVINDCLDGHADCEMRPCCTMFGVWKEGQQRMVELYRSVTLDTLVLAELPAADGAGGKVANRVASA